MAKTGKYRYQPAIPDVAWAQTTTFTTPGRELDLFQNKWASLPISGTANFDGRLGALFIELEGISGASTLTARVCRDANGDRLIMPDTVSTISTGATTAASGSCVYSIDIPYKAASTSVFCLFKVDAGSARIKEISLSWEE